MKKASVIIDFVEDKATVNGEEISLETTSSEHYTIPLTRLRVNVNKNELKKDELALLTVDISKKNDKEKLRMAAKLHQQFGHPTHEKLSRLTKLAGIDDSRLRQKIKRPC